MKFKNTFILVSVMFLTTGCALLKNLSNRPNNSSETSSKSSASSESRIDSSTSFESSSETSSSSGSSSKSSSSSNSSSNTSSSSGPQKVTVAAHTLKDNNPPINVNKKGEVVDKDTWNSFRYAADSKYYGNYNYTYHSYSGGYETLECFTKNGYFARTLAGKIYYERKSGSTFYTYIDVSDGWLREETTFDLQSKYVDRIQNEIYVHMFDFENYEYYEEDDGTYRYIDYGFGAGARFQGGYLTYLYFSNGMNFFEISLSFETTIDIPKSYYYQ